MIYFLTIFFICLGVLFILIGRLYSLEYHQKFKKEQIGIRIFSNSVSLKDIMLQYFLEKIYFLLPWWFARVILFVIGIGFIVLAVYLLFFA